MTRPWVTPQEVRDYTDITAVIERTDAKLSVDIARAEARVMAITHNDFSDEKYATAMPDEVKTAVILLAEAYANSAIKAKTKGMKSETYDDYSYIYSDSAAAAESGLDLISLLDGYILTEAQGTVTMRLRKL